MEVMSSLYASVVGTAVLQQKEVPPRPAHYNGVVRLFDLPPHLHSEATLRAHLAEFGVVTSCELVTYDCSSQMSKHAKVQFENHADARSAVFALKHLGDIGAALDYNLTPYEGEYGRGWCIVEKASASAVIAHLHAAERSGLLPTCVEVTHVRT